MLLRAFGSVRATAAFALPVLLVLPALPVLFVQTPPLLAITYAHTHARAHAQTHVMPVPVPVLPVCCLPAAGFTACCCKLATRTSVECARLRKPHDHILIAAPAEFSNNHRSHFGSRYPLGLMRSAQAFLINCRGSNLGGDICDTLTAFRKHCNDFYKKMCQLLRNGGASLRKGQ
jgi:hypothetical protein